MYNSNNFDIIFSYESTEVKFKILGEKSSSSVDAVTYR